MGELPRQQRKSSVGIQAFLRINGNLEAPVVEISEFLSKLDACYASISSFIFDGSDEIFGRFGRRIRSRDLDYLIDRYGIIEVSLLLSSQDRMPNYSGVLTLHTASFNSPGFWEFAGSLNVFEVIRNGINDRWNRKKEAKLLPYEERRKFLENNILETEAISARVRVLRDIGLSDEEIRILVNRQITQQLDEIEKYQTIGVIENASISGRSE